VPGPKGLPYLGNLLDIDRDSPIEGFMRMAREYGPIFRLPTPAGVRLMISDPVMGDEVCDDERYDKKIAAGLKSIQSSVAGGGLFSSDTENPLWHRRHEDRMGAVLIPSLHRDRGVWGEDAEEWNPDHMSSERVAALPPNAYKPFGTGQRACIGRQFALQEATLVLGMLLQRFVDYLDYELRTRGGAARPLVLLVHRQIDRRTAASWVPPVAGR
jgi:cytochrome P450